MTGPAESKTTAGNGHCWFRSDLGMSGLLQDGVDPASHVPELAETDGFDQYKVCDMGDFGSFSVIRRSDDDFHIVETPVGFEIVQQVRPGNAGNMEVENDRGRYLVFEPGERFETVPDNHGAVRSLVERLRESSGQVLVIFDDVGQRELVCIHTAGPIGYLFRIKKCWEIGIITKIFRFVLPLISY